MVIIAIYPWVDLALFGGISQLLRLWDSKSCPCCRKNTSTKCVTYKQYEDLYAGPEYSMHFKYSAIIMQVYMSFMYGMMIPILFPLALFGFFNMYVNERILLAYYYKQPPVYDLDLHLEALKKVKVAPLLMFMLSYWAIGNS